MGPFIEQPLVPLLNAHTTYCSTAVFWVEIIETNLTLLLARRGWAQQNGARDLQFNPTMMFSVSHNLKLNSVYLLYRYILSTLLEVATQPHKYP